MEAQFLGGDTVNLTAENIHNTELISGENIELSATRDIDIVGGRLKAKDTLILRANGDIKAATQTLASSNNSHTSITLDRQAELTVSQSQGTIDLIAGGNVQLTHAKLESKGDIAIQAQGNINFNFATISSSDRFELPDGGYQYLNQTNQIGTQLNASDNIKIIANGAVHGVAVELEAGKNLSVNAQKEIEFLAAQNTRQEDLSWTQNSAGFLSRKSTVNQISSKSVAAVGSFISGENIQINANDSVGLKAATVISENDLTISSNQNVGVLSEQSFEGFFSQSHTTESGFLSGSGIEFGNRDILKSTRGVSYYSAPSTVGSISGNVTIQAGKQYNQVGSDVTTPAGNVNVVAQSVNIQEARQTNAEQQTSEIKQSGLTLSVSNPVVDATQTVRKLSQAASQTSDSRMQALAAAAAGLNVSNAYSAVQKGQTSSNPVDQAGGVTVSLSYGASASSSTSTANSDTARGSNVVAGGNINIVATGAAQDSNVTVQSSNLQSGGMTHLQADNQVNLLAAANTNNQSSRQTSSSASLGLSMNTNSGTGITASVSKGSGSGAGSDVSYTNTQVSGQQVNIVSGGDTNLKGAVVSANQVSANVGGNLNMQSLQDTSTYQSQSKNASVGVSIPLGPGAVGGSVSLGNTNVNNNYQSVGTQTSIQAGDAGFAVSVNGNTTLNGAVIASTQSAVDNNKNSFTTGGTLTATDIQNNSSFNAKAVGLTLGVSGAGQVPGVPISAAGSGSVGGTATSTTSAGISGVAGNTSVRTGDAQTGLSNTFNAAQVTQNVQAQVAITQAFGQQASKAVGDYAEIQLRDLRKQLGEALRAGDASQAVELKTQIDSWAEDGSNRLALHAVVGGLTSGLGGASGVITSQLLLPVVGDALRDMDMPIEFKKSLILAAATIIGASVGSESGAVTAFNASTNNYLLHNAFNDEESELLRLKKQKSNSNCDAKCNERIHELEALDRLRDEQLAPLIEACQKAGRYNCKGEAIAKNFALANGFGSESIRRESNPGTSGSPFSFNGCPSIDKGGCSYGPLQIAADTGLMKDFLNDLKNNPSVEAQNFFQTLQDAGGVEGAQKQSPAFVSAWMKLTAQDPQFVQYQIDTLINRNLYPVVKELEKVGVSFDDLSTAQKEALFSAAVQHGAGLKSKTKGLDNLLERTFAQVETEITPPTYHTYTRQDLVFGEVEDQMRSAEENNAKLIAQQLSYVSQQLKLEQQKRKLLEKGLGAGSKEIQKIQLQVNDLNQKIGLITEQIKVQNQYIEEAAQYLKAQAKESLSDGEKFIRDFYNQRTQMYPSEEKRYKLEMESILKQYREEQKLKN
jgi:filamentous hemagglutinin